MECRDQAGRRRGLEVMARRESGKDEGNGC